MNVNDPRLKMSFTALLSLMVGAMLTFGVVNAGAEPAAVGEWTVTQEAEGTYSVSWTSPTRLPVTSARPQVLENDRDLGQAITSADGKTVSVTVQSTEAPDPSGLDVVLSGRALDDPAADEKGAGVSAAPLAVPSTTELGVDPGKRGPLEVTSSNYKLPSFKYPGMKGRLEMQGHVVRPADGQLTADAPLVLFLHGRHEFCYSPKNPSKSSQGWPCGNGTIPIPSNLGYDYIQRLLASQGFISVSVAANGINGQDGFILDGGAGARGELVRRHLDKWADWAADDRYDVDLNRVVLVGHSRGGEGVNRAAEEIQLDAPYRIAGQVLLAPTNFARQTTAYVPTVTVLPYCDGDVSDLQGQSYTDVARDLATDDTSLRSSVTVMGANHNFFNTEWTPGISKARSNDDWFGGGRCGKKSPTRLSARQQRNVGETYVAGAVQLMTGTDQSTLPMFDGSAVRVASAGKADIRTQAIGGGRSMIRPGIDASLETGSGAKTQICLGHVARAKRNCGRFTDQSYAPHWTGDFPFGAPSYRAFEMSWTGSGQVGGLALDQPLNLAGKQSLDLRMVVDPDLGNVNLGIKLVDANGESVEYQPPRGGLVPSFPSENRFGSGGKYLAQTVRVPLGALPPSGIDLGQVRSIEIVGAAKKSCRGGNCARKRNRIWLLDLAAVSPSPLPAVPAKRLPLIDLGRARAVEGDGPGVSSVKIPFKVTGEISDPSANFVVAVDRMEAGRPAPRIKVGLTPGQTSGFVKVPYRPNRVSDERTRRMFLNAYALSGAMPRKSPGVLELIDDEPRPKLRIIRPKAKIKPGQVAVWKLKLSRPVGFDVFAMGHVRGLDFWGFKHIPAGKRSTTFRVKTKRNQFKGRPKTLTMQIRAPELDFKRKSRIRVTGT